MSPLRTKICENQRSPSINLTNKGSHGEILSKGKEMRGNIRPAAREISKAILKTLKTLSEEIRPVLLKEGENSSIKLSKYYFHLHSSCSHIPSNLAMVSPHHPPSP